MVCHRAVRNSFGDHWQFGFLRSYAGMGVARGECVRGCQCKPREWDAHIKRQVSQTAISKLAGITALPRTAKKEDGCPCVVRLTLLNQTSSGGTKFKLDALFGGFKMYNTNYAVCASHLCSYKLDGS